MIGGDKHAPQGLHPIVEQMSPNREQLPAVRSRRRDVVVTAGAGTGKTRTLVARYLSLLADGVPLRRIIAITFTRKAAREMRNRVRAEVQRYLAHGDLSPEQRDQWQAVYAGMDAARIGTIHSLCTEILRAHPAEAGVDPRFQVLEEAESTLLSREVVDAALAWAADDPQAASLFPLVGGPDALRGVIQALLTQHTDAAAAFDALPHDVLSHWERILEARRARALNALVAGPAFSDAVATLRRGQPTDPEDAMAQQRRRALEAIDGALPVRAGSAVERIASASALDDISLVGGSYKAWAGGKEAKAAVKDALRTLRSLWRDHADLLSLQLTPIDEQLAEALPALRAVFQFARQRYQAEKGTTHALDFDDLEVAAVELLEDHPQVRARWRRETEQILVDEFQDTNDRQRRLVHLLSGTDGSKQSAGNLFIVGDAKQSIYGFRGADVTVFRAERERIAGGRDRSGSGEGWTLQTSYRAHRGLVRALNDLLRSVLGVEDDPHRPWAEPFAPIQAHRDAPGPGIEPPYVEFHLTVGSKSDGALDRAARALVGRVAELTESGAQVVDDGDLRPLDYGDVAILCRASTSFSAYEDALDEAGLPYVTVAGRGFYDRPEIRDLLNALMALSDPTDDVALVGLLRSPAVALSDADIYHLIRAGEESSRPSGEAEPLWDTLREHRAELGGAAEKRASRAVSLVGDLHALAGRTQVADLLKAFLDRTSYRAALLQAGQRRAVRNIDKLLGDAHASGLVGVGAFLEVVSGLQDSGAREGEARAVSGGAVQIMSVHQAKGLEFPVVVLGDATWSGGGGGRGVLTDPELGVLLPLKDPDTDELPAVYCLAQERMADRGAAEDDRLLYVAATRAREKLLVSGCLGGIKKDGTPYKLSGWLGQLGRPLGLDGIELPYDEEGSAVHRRELHLGETAADCRVYEPESPFYQPEVPSVEPETDVADTPLPPPLLAPVVQEDAPVASAALPRPIGRVVPETDRPRAPAWVVGELVHEALAAWRLPGQDDEAWPPWLRSRARAIGLVDQRQVAQALRRSRRLLTRFQRSPLHGEITTAERRIHEVPYTINLQGRLQTGRIDLLYQRAGTWTIVEFKTDEVRNRRYFDELVSEQDYVPQVREYAVAVEQLLGLRPRCLLCMLDDRNRARVYVVSETGPIAPADL